MVFNHGRHTMIGEKKWLSLAHAFILENALFNQTEAPLAIAYLYTLPNVIDRQSK